jgi:hypothetical protein
LEYGVMTYVFEEPPLVAEKERLKLVGLVPVTEMLVVPGVVRGMEETMDVSAPKPTALLAWTW